MRIRMLAAAVVTAGALMVTLTGAASADGTPPPAPTPLPGDGVVLINCEGGGQMTLTTRPLTEAEREELKKAAPTLTVPAVPAVPALPSGQAAEGGKGAEGGKAGKAEAGRVTITEDVRAVRPDAAPPVLPDGATPPKATDVTVASPLPEGAAKRGEVAMLSTAVPAPGGAAVTEVRVAGKLSEGGTPTVTCAKKAEKE
ncbi:hypothetical protein [Streptosporangium sp. NPDC002524]|uniref:hypothetical protein n=1 Tax=Streptosporangium sp. NPDC002524 TaxID=3154537 RepID=UPI003316EB16